MNTLELKQPRTTKATQNRIEEIALRKARLDPKRRCGAPGCSQAVGPESVGSFCPNHHYRQRKAGHPWHEMPMGLKRRASRKTALRYLELMRDKDREAFLNFLKHGLEKLREPKANALPPIRARNEARMLSTKGKAQIVFAWLNRRKDFQRVALRLLIEAMALELWAACFYQDQKRRLPRLLHTTVGRAATRLAGIKETKIRLVPRWVKRSCYRAGEDAFIKTLEEQLITDRWNPKPLIKTEVGARVFKALREVMPPNWITDQMITETITEYQRTKNERITTPNL